MPKAALSATDGATLKAVLPQYGKAKPVSGRKKPGLKPGQKIRGAPKLRPAQIQAIALAIRERALESPDQPYTYAELEEKYKTSAVTLRSKKPIKEAMDDMRAAAAAAKLETEQACTNAAAPDEELSKAQLRTVIKQLNQELENYRVYYQCLALMYRQRGEPMPQLVAEAESLATGKPIKPSQVSTDAADTVAPIFRK